MSTIEKRLLSILKNTQWEADKYSIVKYLSFMEVLLSIIIDWRDAIGVMNRAYHVIANLMDVRSSANIDAGIVSMKELDVMVVKFEQGDNAY